MTTTAILVPIYRFCEPETEEMLRKLEKHFTVIRGYGMSAIDQARAELATKAIHSGFDNFVWIDGDILFTRQDFDKLMGKEGFRCAPYAIKNDSGKMAVLGEIYGPVGGEIEIQAAGFGFVQTPRAIFESMMTEIPSCVQGTNRQIWPFFQPRWWQNPDGTHTYYGEDYSFCLHARALGHKLICDFDISIGHIGRRAFYVD